MSTHRQIACDVDIPKNKRFGVFANAFRILQDAGVEYLLDFLLYSEQERSAQVVARLRVHAHMLPAIRDRLGLTMTEIQSQGQNSAPKPKDPPIIMPMLMAKPDGEIH